MKYRLAAPGPTPVPENVLTEMAKPILHHRTPAFEAIMAEVRAGLQWLYQTKGDVIMLASSGTGAMEASLINTCSPGDSVLVVNGGKFGERFALIAKAHGLVADTIDVAWGHSVDANVIKVKLAERNYKAVCVQASETSTGACHPIYEISQIVKALPQTLLIVDAITALGVMNLPTDDWGIDIMIGGSQKALMLPPGLATLSVSAKAWSFIEASKSPKFYFDLLAERKSQKKNTTSWTPSVSLICGLREVLKNMQAEGLQNMFERHNKLASAIRNAAKACGLKLLAEASPSNAVTAVCCPEGLDGEKIVGNLRDKLNMTIAEGQDHLKGKIFRVGHLGYYDLLDMVTVWAAIEKQLFDLGHKFDLGAGVNVITKML